MQTQYGAGELNLVPGFGTTAVPSIAITMTGYPEISIFYYDTALDCGRTFSRYLLNRSISGLNQNFRHFAIYTITEQFDMKTVRVLN